jgi:hypothetical protein
MLACVYALTGKGVRTTYAPELNPDEGVWNPLNCCITYAALNNLIRTRGL